MQLHQVLAAASVLLAVGVVSESAQDLQLRQSLERARQDQHNETQMAKRSVVPALPRYYNLAEDGFITSVKGSSFCVSSSAQAAIATVEGSLLKQNNKRLQEIGKLDFSVATMANCLLSNRPSGGCFNVVSGSTNESTSFAAYSVLESMGVVRTLPAMPDTPQCIPVPEYEDLRIRYVPMSSNWEVRRWIFDKGPVLASLGLTKDFIDNYVRAPNTISAATNYTYDVASPSQILGFHMVACTGFDWNYRSKNTNLTGAWICKNSFGRNWGNDGYFKIGVGQLGIMGGVFGDAVGIEAIRDQTYCIRGTKVMDPIDRFPIDLCDLVRAVGLTPTATFVRSYMEAAVSVRGAGVEPFVDCSRAFRPTAPVNIYAYRGLVDFFTRYGILAPFLSAGCVWKSAVEFRFKTSFPNGNQVCANRLTSPAGQPRDRWPIGFQAGDSDADAAYCASEHSKFALRMDGLLAFQGRFVYVQNIDGVDRVSLYRWSDTKFVFNGDQVMLKDQLDKCLDFVDGLVSVVKCNPDIRFNHIYTPIIGKVPPPIVRVPPEPEVGTPPVNSTVRRFKMNNGPGTRCAGKFDSTMPDLPPNTYLVTFGADTPEGDAQFCASPDSIFTLETDGVLRFKSSPVGLVTSYGTVLLARVAASSERFELTDGVLTITTRPGNCLGSYYGVIAQLPCSDPKTRQLIFELVN